MKKILLAMVALLSCAGIACSDCSTCPKRNTCKTCVREKKTCNTCMKKEKRSCGSCKKKSCKPCVKKEKSCKPCKKSCEKKKCNKGCWFNCFGENGFILPCNCNVRNCKCSKRQTPYKHESKAGRAERRAEEKSAESVTENNS